MRSPGLLAAIAATVTTAGIALLGASTVRLAGPKTKRSAEGPSPSYRAELIAPGVLSTPADEYGAAFSPDGRTVCFTRRSPTTTTRPFLVLLVSHLRAGRWSEPEVPPFSGLTNDFAPSFSPDGRRLFFTSDRPAPGRTHAAPGTIGAVGAADGFPGLRPLGGRKAGGRLGGAADPGGAHQHRGARAARLAGRRRHPLFQLQPRRWEGEPRSLPGALAGRPLGRAGEPGRDQHSRL